MKRKYTKNQRNLLNKMQKSVTKLLGINLQIRFVTDFYILQFCILIFLNVFLVYRVCFCKCDGLLDVGLA